MTIATGPPSRGAAAPEASEANPSRRASEATAALRRDCRGFMSIELRELGRDLGGVERDESFVGILLRGDDLLAFPGEDQPRVFLHQRIERLAGLTHRVEAQIYAQRISSGVGV